MTLNFQDYVRAVFYLKSTRGSVKPTDLARRLKVSKNTVSLMVQKLSLKKWMRHRPYGNVELTCRGEKLARQLTYRHRLIELFLASKLGIPSNQVHQEACRLEHDFSEKSIRGLEKLLDHPTECPHGKPLHE